MKTTHINARLLPGLLQERGRALGTAVTVRILLGLLDVDRTQVVVVGGGAILAVIVLVLRMAMAN